MAVEYPNLVAAVGIVEADGTATWASGFSVAHPSTGVYVLKLDAPLDPNASAVIALPRNSGSPQKGYVAQVDNNDDVFKTITFNNMSGEGFPAADTAFVVQVLRRGAH